MSLPSGSITAERGGDRGARAAAIFTFGGRGLTQLSTARCSKRAGIFCRAIARGSQVAAFRLLSRFQSEQCRYQCSQRDLSRTFFLLKVANHFVTKPNASTQISIRGCRYCNRPHILASIAVIIESRDSRPRVRGGDLFGASVWRIKKPVVGEPTTGIFEIW